MTSFHNDTCEFALLCMWVSLCGCLFELVVWFNTFFTISALHALADAFSISKDELLPNLQMKTPEGHSTLLTYYLIISAFLSFKQHLELFDHEINLGISSKSCKHVAFNHF